MSTHGTRACYLRGCDHPECAAAHRRYCKQYRLRASTHPTSLGVDATPVADHVARLHAAGMSYAAIATASGVAETSVKRLAHQRKTHPATRDAILAVTFTSDAGTHYVPALGAARRVQALHTLGYSTQQIASLVGIKRQNLLCIVDGTRVQITSNLARRVAAVYDELCMTPRVGANRYEQGAITRARGMAARLGYAPPLAWDDIDDPDEIPTTDADTDEAEPDPVVIDRLLAGVHVDVPEPWRPAVVRILAAHGISDKRTARLIGVWPETVLRIRRRHDIPAAIPVDGVGLNTHNRGAAA